MSQSRYDDARKLLEDVDDDDPFAESAKQLLERLTER